MKNIIIRYVYHILQPLVLTSLLATISSNTVLMSVDKANHPTYAHNLQTLCNDIGVLSYTTINKYEELKQIVNELKNSIPTKLYSKVFKGHEVDFTVLGENRPHVSLDIKKHFYNVVTALEAFREKKLFEIKKRILSLQNNPHIDKEKLQDIEDTLKHVASHGTTDQMLNTFYEQEHKLLHLENPEVIGIVFVEEILPQTEIIQPTQKPRDGQDATTESGAEEPVEEEEKEHKTERQQDDHLSLNNGDLGEVYQKLLLHIKG